MPQVNLLLSDSDGMFISKLPLIFIELHKVVMCMLYIQKTLDFTRNIRIMGPQRSGKRQLPLLTGYCFALTALQVKTDLK